MQRKANFICKLTAQDIHLTWSIYAYVNFLQCEYVCVF